MALPPSERASGPPAERRLDLHLLPGHFGGAARRFIERLVAGSAAFRVTGWEEAAILGAAEAPAAGGEPAVPSDAAIAEWLLSVPAGNQRRLGATGRIPPGKPFPLRVESFGARAGRTLVGLRATLPAEPGITVKDLEIGLLTLACAALAGDDQGAVVIGADLGPVGAALPTGTIAEQVLGLVDLHGPSLELVLVTADTKDSIGSLPGFEARPFAGLWEFRRA